MITIRDATNYLYIIIFEEAFYGELIEYSHTAA